MKLTPLHDKEFQMRTAGFMSGSGSNLVEILKHEKELEKERGKSPYKIVVIFSDNCGSIAEKIGKRFNLPVVFRDIEAWYYAKRQPKNNLELRPEYDSETVKALEPYEAVAAAYAGYMSVASYPLIKEFLGINVHPADLRICNESGKRRYTGDNAVLDAITSREKYLRSTTHIVEPEVDGGRILMVSAPLAVTLPFENFNPCNPDNKRMTRDIAKVHQESLKEAGDWLIFPKTLELIADRRFQKDEAGNLYFDEKKIPSGIKYEDLKVQ